MRGRTVAAGLGLAFGDGPVFAILTGAPQETGDALVSVGEGIKVLWIWDSTYNGAVHVRGARTDAGGTVRFEASAPAVAAGDDLTLPAGAPADDSGWHVWGSLMYPSSPGCYALQADGDGFSAHVVFEAHA